MPSLPPQPARSPGRRLVPRAAAALAVAALCGPGWVATAGGAAVAKTTTTTTAAHPTRPGATTTTSGPKSTGPASPSTTTTTTTAPPQVTGLGTPTFLPLPAGATGFTPAAMDCPTVFSCVVVGSLQMASGSRAAAVSVQSGATWDTVAVPLPTSSLGITGGIESALTAVSCATDAGCVAIGGFGPAADAAPTQGLLESGSGASWTASSVPVPQNAATDARAGSTLSALACPGTGACVIAGSYVGPADIGFPLLVTGAPGSWSDAPFGLPADAAIPSGSAGAAGPSPSSGVLSAVACASPSGCAVVGAYATSTPGHPTSGVVLWGSGSTWAAQSVPGPTGEGVASLGQVACAAPQSCLAIGTAAQSAGAPNPAVPLLAEGSGGSWSTVTLPLPPGATDPTQVSLDAVACAANSDCSAFGHYAASSGGTPSGYFTVTGSAGNPTVLEAGKFLVWPGNPWGSVQCPQAAMVCLTGYDGPGSQSVALGWGATWTTTQVPVPAGEPAGTSMRLVGVNCPGPTTCVVLLAGTLAGSAGSAGSAGPPENAVVQPVSVPDLSAPTPTTTTAPAPTPPAGPTTTVPAFAAAPTTTTTAQGLQKGSLGALAAHKQPVGTATVVLGVVAGLLLVALLVLWARLARAKHAAAAAGDPGEVIALGGTSAVGPPPGPAPPVPGAAPAPGEPTGLAPALTELPGAAPDTPGGPPVPAPFFPVPAEPPPAAPSSSVVPPPAAWATPPPGGTEGAPGGGEATAAGSAEDPGADGDPPPGMPPV